MEKMKKGFTLLELLIVIGIIAILATATVLVLNPAELLREARDSQRLSDLDSMKSAISLLLATAINTPELDGAPSADYCATQYFVASSTTAGYYASSSIYQIRPSGVASGTEVTSSSARGVSGGGWIKIDLTKATGGSPIPALPVDPSPASDRAYIFGCDQSALTFELDANLESVRYSTKEGNDGGNNSYWFEVGTDPGLDL
ncbi:MAG: type II secretion system protein [Parcubacteria group bacterium]|nr:type II secretion system protein [Parcubacteria group bacterium]